MTNAVWLIALQRTGKGVIANIVLTHIARKPLVADASAILAFTVGTVRTI
jgi:hypothetical protein